MAQVEYIEEQRSVVLQCDPAQQTLLDVSLAAGLPHYHSCGAAARCSTCRVLVLDGLESFGPRGEAEETLAARREWPDEIRLACQARPTGPATVRRVITDDVDADLAASEISGWPAAEERELAVLFCDIANFTGISENQLAYDIVHSLNRFFRAMGDPILANQGIINKYLGDGLLALFGMTEGTSREDCARQAVRASLRMLAAARQLNVYLQDNFGFSFEPRIGLHYGRVFVGQIGHPEKIDCTVIGDPVNAASRIEAANKEHGTRLLASEDLVAPLLDALSIGKVVEQMVLRGRRESLRLYEILGFKETDTAFMVQTTFERLLPQAHDFARVFYARLFELEPEIRPLFAHVEMPAMRRMLMQTIGTTVRGLEALPAAKDSLRALGARHAEYGVQPAHYPAAGQALLYALAQFLGPDFTPEVERAWQEVFALIRQTMLEGTSQSNPDEAVS